MVYDTLGSIHLEHSGKGKHTQSVDYCITKKNHPFYQIILVGKIKHDP